MELLKYLKQATNTATNSIKSSQIYRDEMLLNLKYQKAIHGISTHRNNNFSSENIKKIYSEFSDKAEYLQKSIEKLTAKAQNDFSNAYSELEKNARFVTIMLFGRSRTGKSTMMEALTSGDGHTIGIGKQNTTTEIKEYFLPKTKNGEIPTKDALRIVDTPGIEGFDGEELAKMAERYIERCDHIFFLLSDDKATSSELDRFGYIQTQGKGITVLLNIKSFDEDIDLLVENLNIFLRETR